MTRAPKSRKARLVLLLTIILAAAATPAFGQPQADAWEELLDRAGALYQAGHSDSALVVLEQALAITPGNAQVRDELDRVQRNIERTADRRQ